LSSVFFIFFYFFCKKDVFIDAIKKRDEQIMLAIMYLAIYITCMSLESTKTGRVPAKLKHFMSLDNIAPEISDNKLSEIARNAIADVEEDNASSERWNRQVTEALKIASQIIEAKNTPWPGAANVKYPLLLTGALQFNARIVPEVVQNDEVVHGKVMLSQPNVEQEDRASRIGTHMSYQLLHVIPNWFKDTDKMLLSLSIIGMMYRKVYYDPIRRRPQIDLCMPADIVVNNSVDSLETAPRITHILRLKTNDLISNMRAGLYTDYSLEELCINPDEEFSDAEAEERTITDKTATIDQLQAIDGYHEVYEQHTELDLDEDNYKEPYIILIHKKSQKVLRIYARYDEESFTYNSSNGEVIDIEAIQYFVDYCFLPPPDCTYHSLGFGHYLYPLNKAINSITNQLIDAASLSNRGGGMISRSLRMRKQNIKWKIGEFVSVEVPNGQTLQNSIFPMPVKEPSPALFNLFELLLKSAQELASISDVLQGQAPPANTPATTVVAMIEQGTKIYSAILNRLHTSFRKEYQLLYNLNKKYLDSYETYQFAQLTGEIKIEDYQMPEYGVFPVADPNMSSDATRLARSQALMQILENPLINQHEIIKRYLKALRIPDPDSVLPPPQPPQPSPEDIKAQADAGLTQAKTDLTKAQAHDILMSRELEAIRLSSEERLKEKELQIEAAAQGALVAKNKIDSTIELAQADQELGAKAIAKAEQQEQAFEEPLLEPDISDDTDQKIEGIENILEQTLGISTDSAEGPILQQSPAIPQSQSQSPGSESVDANMEADQSQAPSPGTDIPLPRTKALSAVEEADSAGETS
jgi:chaperonin GroES